ncbi:MAG: glycosyltransferase family 2 protein [Steroidobacteraceae bacterium]
MTCYNEGAYIGTAVRSVLAQTWAEVIDRIVIADDGSRADTIAVLNDIAQWDPRIHVIYGLGGAGLPTQRNLAIRATQSPLIAILDGDDVWSEDKLERQLPAMNDPQIGLVYSKYYTFSDSLDDAHGARVRDITKGGNLTHAYFLNDPPIIPSTTLIRRAAFDACDGFDPAVRVFEDTDFYLRLSRVCRFSFVDSPVLYKRYHPSSITGGRKDLMAHHAYVALKAAAMDPSLLSLVPRRLAERARKLGNHHFLLGQLDDARQMIRFAVRLDPLNLRAWTSWLVTGRLASLVNVMMSSRWRKRRAAIGALRQPSALDLESAAR